MGLVANLNRPDNNITGVTSLQMEVTAKRFGFLHALLPKATRFAVLINPNSRNAKSEITDAEVAASSSRHAVGVSNSQSPDTGLTNRPGRTEQADLHPVIAHQPR